jgi:hypothetical protein
VEAAVEPLPASGLCAVVETQSGLDCERDVLLQEMLITASTTQDPDHDSSDR